MLLKQTQAGSNRKPSLVSMTVRVLVVPLLILVSGAIAAADITVVDDSGNAVAIKAPAQRIVSLAPHVTEQLFAAGAGANVVGAVKYSDYPEAAKAIPRVGGYRSLDLEAIVALKPDLVVSWESGNAARHISQLRQFGLPVFVSEPRDFEAIATGIERLGHLAGTEAQAREAAATFRHGIAALRKAYAGRSPVSVFYQVWNQPLMTINDGHLISRVIELCGGENIFYQLPTLAPQIDTEAVLSANPEAIVASGMGEARPEWLDDWRKWPHLQAVKRDNLFFIPPDLIQRHTPRILDGATMMCRHLERARQTGRR